MINNKRKKSGSNANVHGRFRKDANICYFKTRMMIVGHQKALSELTVTISYAYAH